MTIKWGMNGNAYPGFSTRTVLINRPRVWKTTNDDNGRVCNTKENTNHREVGEHDETNTAAVSIAPHRLFPTRRPYNAYNNNIIMYNI